MTSARTRCCPTTTRSSRATCGGAGRRSWSRRWAAAAETLATAFAAVDRGGEVVVLGLFDAPRGLDVTDAVLRGVRARFAAAAGVSGGTSDLARALEQLAAEPALARLLTHRFPLADVDEAFAAAGTPGTRALKVLVRPT